MQNKKKRRDEKFETDFNLVTRMNNDENQVYVYCKTETYF